MKAVFYLLISNSLWTKDLIIFLFSIKKSANPDGAVRRAKMPWLPEKVFHVTSNFLNIPKKGTTNARSIALPSTSNTSDIERAEIEQEKLREMDGNQRYKTETTNRPMVMAMKIFQI